MWQHIGPVADARAMEHGCKRLDEEEVVEGEKIPAHQSLNDYGGMVEVSERPRVMGSKGLVLAMLVVNSLRGSFHVWKDSCSLVASTDLRKL